MDSKTEETPQKIMNALKDAITYNHKQNAIFVKGPDINDSSYSSSASTSPSYSVSEPDSPAEQTQDLIVDSAAKKTEKIVMMIENLFEHNHFFMTIEKRNVTIGELRKK